jgi:hypothetical protein
MSMATIAKTDSRKVLGSMNDFGRLLEAYLTDGVPLAEVSVKLAQAPCGPIGMDSPERVTRAVFATGANAVKG